jgi:hypothetical protein
MERCETLYPWGLIYAIVASWPYLGLWPGENISGWVLVYLLVALQVIDSKQKKRADHLWPKVK